MLKFKCPKCNCNELEVVETDITNSSKVVNINEKGYFEYELIESTGGQINRFQCFDCGYVLKNEGDNIVILDDVVEWIKSNRPQK